MVISILLYGTETWTLKAPDVCRLTVFQSLCLYHPGSIKVPTVELGRLDEGRIPKQLLFGELMQSLPFYGPKKRWCDEVAGDLHAMGVGDEWSQLCQNHKQWSEMCSSAVDVLAQNRGQLLVLLMFLPA